MSESSWISKGEFATEIRKEKLSLKVKMMLTTNLVSNNINNEKNRCGPINRRGRTSSSRWELDDQSEADRQTSADREMHQYQNHSRLLLRGGYGEGDGTFMAASHERSTRLIVFQDDGRCGAACDAADL
jgi:hypothetical protein